MHFRIAVVLKKKGEGVESNAVNKDLFLTLRDGTVVMGKSSSHIQLWRDYCNTRCQSGDVAPQLFAAGSCERGKLDFTCSDFQFKTPGYDQASLTEFLAGVGLEKAISAEEQMHGSALDLVAGFQKILSSA